MYQHSLEKNGLFFLNRKQTGVTAISLSSMPGAEVMVFGKEMILSLHRMKEGKLSPRQAASDRPQTDQCRHPHEFLNLPI